MSYRRAISCGVLKCGLGALVVLLLAVGALAQSPPACVQPPPGLIAWWRGEDNALESIGTNHGTLQNEVTFTNGMVGQAFQFDGTNDLVDLGGNSPFRRTDAITCAFWARLPSDGGGPATGAGAAGGQGFGGVYLDRTNFYFTWTPAAPDSDAYLVALGVSLPANQWMHFAVAVNYTNQAGAIYINGQAFPTAVTNLIGQPIVTWGPNGQYNVGRSDSIGGRFVNTQQFFKGQLDEVDIYSRALTASEIADIVAAGSAGKCLPCAPAQLTIGPDALQPGRFQVQWPVMSSDYVLESTTGLDASDWTPVGEAVSVTNTTFRVTINPTNATRFFRLRCP